MATKSAKIHVKEQQQRAGVKNNSQGSGNKKELKSNWRRPVLDEQTKMGTSWREVKASTKKKGRWRSTALCEEEEEDEEEEATFHLDGH